MTNHRGFKISTAVRRKDGVRELTTKIDGHVLEVRTAIHPNRDAAVEMARQYVNESIMRPDAYTWTRDLTALQLYRKVR